MKINNRRRFLLQSLSAGAALPLAARRASANASPAAELLGKPTHKVVYQFNKADLDYMEHVLSSVGSRLRKYTDDIHIVVTAFGPGVHILAKHPLRPVPDTIRQRVESLAIYGVTFHVCGNTLQSLDWTEDDLLEFAEVVDVGASSLMTLQERGYSYISW